MTSLNTVKTLSSPQSPSRWLAAGLFLLTLIGPLATGWLTLVGCDPFSINDASARLPLGLTSGPAFAILGSLIFVYRPQNRIGWLCLALGFSLPGSNAVDLYIQCGLTGTIAAPGMAYVAWFMYSYSTFAIIPLVFLLPMVYPTGRFLSPRWRWLAIASLIVFALIGTGLGLIPDFSRSNGMDRYPVANPFGLLPLPAWWFSLFYTLSNLGFVFLNLAGVAAIAMRFRRSVGDERQQMKWLAYFLTMAVGVQMLFFNIPGAFFYPQILESVWFDLILWVIFLGFPLVIGIAIFKYRLYAIDVIINRTLVYGGLTLLITAAYVLFVGGIGTLAANQSGQVIGLVLATAIVVAAIRPLHRSLQTTANRFVAVPASLPSPQPSPTGRGGKSSPPIGEAERGRTVHRPSFPPPNTEGVRNTASTPTQPKPFVRWIALVIWLLIVLAHLILFLFDLNVDFSQMLVPCAGADCNFLAISSAEVAVLTSWGLTTRTYALAMIIVPVVVLLVYWTLGGLILWRQGTSRLGLAVSLALIVMPIITYSTDTDWTIVNPNLVFLGMVVANLGTVVVLVFLYLMPNGRFSPRWAYIPLACTFLLLNIQHLEIIGIVILSAQASSLVNSTLVSLVLLGGGLQIYRYLRDSNPIERQQTKWILFGVLSFVLSVVVWVLIFGGAVDIPAGETRLLANFGGWFSGIFTLLMLPAAITIAILRYKLWDIDLIINRTLVYGGLTLVVVLIYIFTVGLLSLLFQTSGNLITSLIATGLIAVAFHPVRERLQRRVNRLMFGQRDDPYAVLSQLSQRLQTTAVPRETLTSIVETIAGTLKLPYAAIELVEQMEQIGRAAVGQPVGDIVAFPLRYQKETVGRLMVSPRAPGEKFTTEEQQLLDDIAGQTGAVASATRLTLALQRSRERLVLAREEERRRIRRDLHDGLGPTLASQTLKLDAVLDLLAEDPQAAAQQITQLKDQTQLMVADIRRLVYELRPPALDELGLSGALQAHLVQMHGVNNGLHISIESSPDPLPPLPAAAEVAAYRITLEAVTNVIRHARASQCWVRLAIENGHLSLHITDNGIGLPQQVQTGVGLISMRERAEELGGTCVIECRDDGGTEVVAKLSLPQELS